MFKDKTMSYVEKQPDERDHNSDDKLPGPLSKRLTGSITALAVSGAITDSRTSCSHHRVMITPEGCA